MLPFVGAVSLLSAEQTVRPSTAPASQAKKNSCLKNTPLRALPGAAERLALCKADLLDYDVLRSTVSGCHGVFHNASPGSNPVCIRVTYSST
jgi:hypothetical protein